MRRVVIAGGTGFIGRALVDEFCDAGYDVGILSRTNNAVEGAQTVKWDGASVGTWTESLEGAHVVVNVCGESIMQRWTPASLKRIRNSRVESTKLIGEAVAVCKNPPKIWLNACAVGWYGDTGSREVSEATGPANDALGRLCQEWEAAVDKTPTLATTKTKMRLGVVLGKDGDAFKTLVKVTKMLLGGPLGSGKQFVPWIHVNDLARLFVWAADNPVEGVVNATAPYPVTNEVLMAALRKRYGMPPTPPAPSFAVEAYCKFKNWEPSLLLGGTKALPTIATARGFKFEFPMIDGALDNLVDDVPKAWKSPGAVAA